MNELHRRRMFGLVGAGVAYNGLASVQAQPTDPVLTVRDAAAGTPLVRRIDVNGVELAYRHHVGAGERQ